MRSYEVALWFRGTAIDLCSQKRGLRNQLHDLCNLDTVAHEGIGIVVGVGRVDGVKPSAIVTVGARRLQACGNPTKFKRLTVNISGPSSV
jgi:hypothetical protein